MPRPLRNLPRPNTTFELTTRTLHGRLLLRPSTELNQIILGILGKALGRYPLLLHLVVVASNHIHLIVTAASVKQLADFMCYVNSNIAREAGRMHRWWEKFWGRRYRAIPILDDAKLIERAAYLLSHGCKEGLVLRPGDWPGVNCVEALCRGKRLTGVWYDRICQYEAERAGLECTSKHFAERVAVPLSPLPCFAALSAGQQRSHYRALVRDIEHETRRRLARGGKRILGARRVRAQPPQSRPKQVKRSPAPLCHCTDPEQRRRFRDDFRWFTSLYRDAARRLKAGELGVSFPAHCFPPALAYVGLDPPG